MWHFIALDNAPDIDIQITTTNSERHKEYEEKKQTCTHTNIYSEAQTNDRSSKNPN